MGGGGQCHRRILRLLLYDETCLSCRTYPSSEFGTVMAWKIALTTASTKYEASKRRFLTPVHIHAFTMLHTAAASTVMKLILWVSLNSKYHSLSNL